MNKRKIKVSVFMMFLIGCLVNVEAQNPSEGKIQVEWDLNKSELSPYEKIIDTGAVTKEGLFNIHLQNDRMFFEIPIEELGRKMIIVRDGRGFRNVIWEYRDGNILLLAPDVESSTGTKIISNFKHKRIYVPNLPAIAGLFPILTIGEEGTVVIEVTTFFLSEKKGFLNLEENIDLERSYFKDVRVYPEAIEMDVIQTATGGPGSMPLTFKSQWSIAPLPKNPMRPRLYDRRMGFRRDDGIMDRKIKPYKAAIHRWRLEKKDASKKLSEPINPIVFYLDPLIPEKWKKWVRRGIYAWLPAFEAAGFKNAIVVLDEPKNDPEWSVADLQYSVVRWRDNTKKRKIHFARIDDTGSGTVNEIIDMRTGEILKADIIIGPPFEWDRYFIRAAPLDDRAEKLPLPDVIIGQLIKALVSHEAGHAFGLVDGHYGEFAYPFIKMRSSSWLKKMGHTPSIMNYARENYIVQPKDSISPIHLI